MVKDQIVLDPTSLEDKESGVHFTVAFMPSLGELTHLLQSGKVQYEQTQEAIELCIDGCTGPIVSMMRQCLVSF